jgi:hypothetical protein
MIIMHISKDLLVETINYLSKFTCKENDKLVNSLRNLLCSQTYYFFDEEIEKDEHFYYLTNLTIEEKYNLISAMHENFFVSKDITNEIAYNYFYLCSDIIFNNRFPKSFSIFKEQVDSN